MAGPYVADRIKQTSTTTGTGTLSLSGIIPMGALSFVSGIGSGNTCYFCVAHQVADEWEVRLGMVTSASPDTLSRGTLLASSTGSAISFSAGTKDVFVVSPAKYAFPFLKITGTDAVQVQDETYLGGVVGDARGNGANDFQRYRQNADQVASGTYCVISSGTRNKNSGNCAFIGSGNNNVCSGDRAALVGGEGNTVSAKKTFVGGGQSNTAGQAYSVCVGGYGNNAGGGGYTTICGGSSNTTGSNQCFIGGGDHNNTHSGGYQVICGGRFNNTYAFGCGILSGLGAAADKYCQQTQAAGGFSFGGDAQTSTIVMRINTTNATPTEMFLDGSSVRLTMNNYTSWAFEILIVARRTNATDESAAYQILGCADKNSGAGTIALVGSITKVVIAEDNAAWDVDVTADTTNSSVKITVTGETSKNIQWVAFVRLVETSN